MRSESSLLMTARARMLSKPLVGLFVASAMALTFCLLGTTSAMAEFGFKDLNVTFKNDDGSPDTQAGSHPYAMTTIFDFNTMIEPLRGEIVDGSVKDVVGFQVPGLVGKPNAAPTCSTVGFLTSIQYHSGEAAFPDCPDSTAVGVTTISLGGALKVTSFPAVPIYNLEAPPGVAQKLGFVIQSVPVTVEITVNPALPHNLIARVSNISTVLQFGGTEFTLWGDPADPAHDGERGHCLGNEQNETCPADIPNEPYITVPRACQGPLTTTWAADTWQHPGTRLSNGLPDLSDPAWAGLSAVTHDGAEPPNPQGFTGCGKLGFNPTIVAQPTTLAAQSPTGLDFGLNVHDEGLTNPTGMRNRT